VAILVIMLLGLLFSLGSTTTSGTATAVGGKGPPTSLVVESTSPLVVRGEGFKPGEEVTVTAFTGTRPATVKVKAKAATGTFRARLRLSGGKCGGAKLVRARGDRGTVATIGLDGGICIPPPLRP
jgi:hypothetical protein